MSLENLTLEQRYIILRLLERAILFGSVIERNSDLSPIDEITNWLRNNWDSKFIDPITKENLNQILPIKDK